MIGWREDALKMVFLVTDQNYHTAGDGKVLNKFNEHKLNKFNEHKLNKYHRVPLGNRCMQ